MSRAFSIALAPEIDIDDTLVGAHLIKRSFRQHGPFMHGRVADWYIDQAFQLFPVIEIDAGREIDVVLTGTFEMNLPSEDG